MLDIVARILAYCFCKEVKFFACSLDFRFFLPAESLFSILLSSFLGYKLFILKDFLELADMSINWYGSPGVFTLFILALSFLSAVIRGLISSEGFKSIFEVSNAFTISGQVFLTTYFRYWLLLELEDESIFLSATAELFFFI